MFVGGVTRFCVTTITCNCRLHTFGLTCRGVLLERAESLQNNSLPMKIVIQTCYICNGQIDKMDYNLVQGDISGMFHLGLLTDFV